MLRDIFVAVLIYIVINDGLISSWPGLKTVVKIDIFCLKYPTKNSQQYLPGKGEPLKFVWVYAITPNLNPV